MDKFHTLYFLSFFISSRHTHTHTHKPTLIDGTTPYSHTHIQTDADGHTHTIPIRYKNLYHFLCSNGEVTSDEDDDA